MRIYRVETADVRAVVIAKDRKDAVVALGLSQGAIKIEDLGDAYSVPAPRVVLREDVYKVNYVYEITGPHVEAVVIADSGSHAVQLLEAEPHHMRELTITNVGVARAADKPRIVTCKWSGIF